LPVGATPPKSLYKTPSPLLNILGVRKLLLYTTGVPEQGVGVDAVERCKSPQAFWNACKHGQKQVVSHTYLLIQKYQKSHFYTKMLNKIYLKDFFEA
jgi:hypothetical protein